jgi:hypothetical protein
MPPQTCAIMLSQKPFCSAKQAYFDISSSNFIVHYYILSTAGDALEYRFSTTQFLILFYFLLVFCCRGFSFPFFSDLKKLANFANTTENLF